MDIIELRGTWQDDEDDPLFSYRDDFVVGRAVEAQLRIAFSTVSRKHARFYKTTEGWWVEDLRSKNGTKVNGYEIYEPTLLLAGDRVSTGESTLRVAFKAEKAVLAPG